MRKILSNEWKFEWSKSHIKTIFPERYPFLNLTSNKTRLWYISLFSIIHPNVITIIILALALGHHNYNKIQTDRHFSKTTFSGQSCAKCISCLFTITISCSVPTSPRRQCLDVPRLVYY